MRCVGTPPSWRPGCCCVSCSYSALTPGCSALLLFQNHRGRCSCALRWKNPWRRPRYWCLLRRSPHLYHPLTQLLLIRELATRTYNPPFLYEEKAHVRRGSHSRVRWGKKEHFLLGEGETDQDRRFFLRPRQGLLRRWAGRRELLPTGLPQGTFLST